MRWWVFVIVGVLVYLVTLVASLPVQHLAGALTTSGLPLVIGRISGSVWRGEAQQLSYKQVPLGPAEWTFVPWGLLQGRIEFDLSLKHPDHTLAGSVAKDILSDGWSLSDVKGQIPAESLLQLADQASLGASGQLDLDLRRLRLSQRRLTAAAGEVRWLDAGIDRPFRVELGNLQFNLSGDEQALKSDIKELDGPMQVNGEFSLQPDGSYRLQGKVTPGSGADPGLVSLLQSIGRPASGGSIQIDYAGRL